MFLGDHCADKAAAKGGGDGPSSAGESNVLSGVVGAEASSSIAEDSNTPTELEDEEEVTPITEEALPAVSC